MRGGLPLGVHECVEENSSEGAGLRRCDETPPPKALVWRVGPERRRLSKRWEGTVGLAHRGPQIISKGFKGLTLERLPR